MTGPHHLHVIAAPRHQEHSGLPVEGCQNLILLKAIDHSGHIHHPHLAPIERLANDNLLKVRLGIGEILCSQLHVARAGADLTHRHIH